MVCFYTSCAGLTSKCADTNINVGDTIRYSRTVQKTLRCCSLYFHSDCTGFISFHAYVLYDGAQKVYEPIQLDTRTGEKWKELSLF